MFLTVHSTVAITLTQNIHNPAGAFLIGVISHFILDSIPHGDEIFEKIGIKGMAKLAIIDHVGVIIMLSSIFLFKPDFIFTSSIIFAIIGAMTPDWLMAIYELSKSGAKLPIGSLAPLILRFLNKITKPVYKLHSWVHRVIKYDINFSIGITLQIILLVGFWLII